MSTGYTYQKDDKIVKTQGIRQKKKDKEKAEAPEKSEIEKERSKLEKHVILKDLPPHLQQAYRRFKSVFSEDMLFGILGIEYAYLSSNRSEMSMEKYTTQMCKILETMRRMVASKEGGGVYIPDQVKFVIEGYKDGNDTSDEPEFE
tara:strand:- start:405 stop:842 length:438 start_codon:yes stop_codon:yes gene_type:complete